MTDPRPTCGDAPSALADRQACLEIVGRRAHVPEIGVAQKCAHVTEILLDELLVQTPPMLSAGSFNGSRAKADGCAICTPTT